jgi:hypothetical protein
MSNTKIDRREDVKSRRGESKYGDVEFADPTNNKYPIDTPEHTRAAWNYIITKTTLLNMTRMKSKQSKIEFVEQRKNTE